MKIAIKKSIFRLSVLALFSLAAFPTLAQAATTTSGTYDFKKQSGLGAAATVAGYDTGTSATSIESVISTIIYVLLSFVGLIFFGLLIYGAYNWMTAGGNDEKVKKATSLITNALIGLVITISAYALSYFLISYFW